jgi:TonB family protein
MTRARLATAVLLASCFAWTAPLAAEEPPLAVGSEGVPVPKKVKDLKPKYPPEAMAQGIRGIVILDLVIDTAGTVESVSVVRSVPGLDDAAVAAAHQWRYEPVKVGGRPARVRMTVPITFSLALPALARDPGVPELRQGVMPTFPGGAQGGGKATVAIMLDSEGRITAKGAMEGSAEPWTGALLAALDTWRFSSGPDDRVVSFRIEASFSPGRGSQANIVSLRATGLKIVEARSAQAAPATPSAPTTPPSAAPTATTAQPPAPAPPAPAGTAQQAPSSPPPTTGPLPQAPGTTASPAPAAPTPAPAAAAAAPTPPPLEIVSAPLPPAPLENGVSAVRDVTLAPGVPDLARGRRPVPPPVARLAGATGIVEVAFSVSVAGATMIQKVTGPDILKKAAEQAVVSWVFRRTRADRAYLFAVFDFAEDRATASVRPQAAPQAPAPASAAPAPASATPAPASAAPAATGAHAVTPPAEATKPAAPSGS